MTQNQKIRHHSRVCRFFISFCLCLSGSFISITSAQPSPVSLSLDEAIQFALANNVQLQSVREGVTSANIALQSAQSEFGIQIRPDLSGALQAGDNVEQRYGVQVNKKFPIGGELGWNSSTRIDKTASDSYRTEVTLRYTQPLLQGRGRLAVPPKSFLPNAELVPNIAL
jgi:outer membrane protein TolC